MIEHADRSGPFWVHDQPAAPVQIFIDTDLTGFTHVSAKLNGAVFGVVPVNDDPVDPYEFPWPVEPFPTSGRYELAADALVMVEGATTARIRVGTTTVIVMEDDGWHTLDSARQDWADAPDSDSNLYDLLEVARMQVIEYAPALAEGAPIPTNYRLGQIMQTRALWQSSLANSSDQINGDGFTVTVYPMDRTIKNVLRPKHGAPRTW